MNRVRYRISIFHALGGESFTAYGSSCGGGLDFLADGGTLFALGTHEFIIELEIHPHARGDAEVIAEAEVVFGGAAALALFHLSEVGCRDSAAAGDLGLRQAGFLQGFPESLGKEVEQGNLGGFHFHVKRSVVVGDSDMGGAAAFPLEDDAPLLVDADAPESLEIAGEGFEAIGRWLAELIDGDNPVNLAEFHQSPWLDVAGEFPRRFPRGRLWRFLCMRSFRLPE